MMASARRLTSVRRRIERSRTCGTSS
jgi:hypothetical protein